MPRAGQMRDQGLSWGSQVKRGFTDKGGKRHREPGPWEQDRAPGWHCCLSSKACATRPSCREPARPVRWSRCQAPGRQASPAPQGLMGSAGGCGRGPGM